MAKLRFTPKKGATQVLKPATVNQRKKWKYLFITSLLLNIGLAIALVILHK